MAMRLRSLPETMHLSGVHFALNELDAVAGFHADILTWPSTSGDPASRTA